MLQLSSQYLRDSGGLLAALTRKSAEYLNSIIGQENIKGLPSHQRQFDRIVIHQASHLDEFAADLMLLASVPDRVLEIEFVEQALESKDDDLQSQLIWPSAAVIGIGSTSSGGAKPLILFDEHLPDGSRSHPSATSMVCSTLYSKLPLSISRLTREVDAIDEYGGAHQQHLGNLIKSLHDVRFATRLAGSEEIVGEYLGANWKRAVIHASLTAIVYCLQEGLDLVEGPEGKVDALKRSFEKYCEKTPNRTHPQFPAAQQWLKMQFYNQAKHFANAQLRDKRSYILDERGKRIPQLLMLSRVLFAIEKSWGDFFAAMIGMHLWEVELQKQLDFEVAKSVVEPLLTKREEYQSSTIGAVRCAYVPVKDLSRELWIVAVTPYPGHFAVSKACQALINKMNDGYGLVLVDNDAIGTKVLFRGGEIPDAWWLKLCEAITVREPECWYELMVRGGVADFLLNGNATHRYYPRSALDIESLTALARGVG